MHGLILRMINNSTCGSNVVTLKYILYQLNSRCVSGIQSHTNPPCELFDNQEVSLMLAIHHELP